MHPDSARRSETGFTILEGMIAAGVLALGLLTDVYGINAKYRDVADRIKALKEGGE